jgi:hypothetical protein
MTFKSRTEVENPIFVYYRSRRGHTLIQSEFFNDNYNMDSLCFESMI